MKKLSPIKFILATSLLAVAATPVFASLNDDLAANDAKQKALQAQINSTKTQENTLANQIVSFNNQISLAQLQVDDAQAKLDSVTNDLTILTAQLTKLQADLTTLTRTAVIRFRVTQAIEEANPLTTSFASGNFTDDAETLTYKQYISHKDQELMSQMLDLKNQMQATQADLTTKQAQAQTNRDQLASAKSNLDSQKAGKVSLLATTQGSEARYQKMLEAAKREEEQIIIAYNNKGGSRYVHRGDPIGTEGCTGYCFGAHLHFALYPGTIKTTNSQNPCNVLSCQFIADTGNGLDGYVRSGKYLLPIHWPGQSYATVSQWWGMTWFARPPYNGYGGGPHTGVDMYANEGDTIYAAEDGQAYFYRGGQTNGNGVFIYHPDGMVTLYWHLQ